MKRLEVSIVIGFAIMFVAGMAVGVAGLSARSRMDQPSPVAPASKPDDHFHTLGSALNLTTDEKQKMEAIWKDAHARSDRLHKAMADDDKARDLEIRKLLTPEQLSEYDEIQHAHDASVARYRAEIHTEMDDTHKKIRAILTPEQAEKFDQMARDRGYRHGPPPMGGSPGESGFGPPHRHHHGPDTSTSRPETNPSP